MQRKVMFGILGIVLCGVIYLLYVFNYIPHRKYTNDYFQIEPYISEVDKDLDGVDDQTDILNGVRSYLQTNPKYKSAYYAEGYPNDGYGVCTDVVAFGLKEAGYDLRELVFEDVLEYPNDYNIDTVDKNIDFRRVENLKVYLDHQAISLTTDIHDFKEWQGGDIVVFDGHIGVISDYRNAKGIPFVLHHANPYQRDYEEDILELKQNNVIGHYRIS